MKRILATVFFATTLWVVAGFFLYDSWNAGPEVFAGAAFIAALLISVGLAIIWQAKKKVFKHFPKEEKPWEKEGFECWKTRRGEKNLF